MATINDLRRYFTDGVIQRPDRTWGVEIETFIMKRSGVPADADDCQAVFKQLERLGWTLRYEDGWIHSAQFDDGSVFLLEQGYHCIELASSVTNADSLIWSTKMHLGYLYQALEACELMAMQQPVIEWEGNLLAPEDTRSAMWLELDGVESGNIPPRTASVQFTFAVRPELSIVRLNQLNARRGDFLRDYLQDALWHEHMATSHAGYRHDRYGGPGYFCDLEHYIQSLADHDAIDCNALIPYAEADLSTNEQAHYFIKSIWWYFRLKRYGDVLCIEVRPLPRRSDDCLDDQLALVQKIVSQ